MIQSHVALIAALFKQKVQFVVQVQMWSVTPMTFVRATVQLARIGLFPREHPVEMGMVFVTVDSVNLIIEIGRVSSILALIRSRKIILRKRTAVTKEIVE